MNPVKNIAGFAGGVARQGFDLLRKVPHLRPSPKPEMTDQTLKSKVESVVFRSADIGRSDVNVTVVDRRVTLHGKAKSPAAVKAMEAAARAIPEVASVENRLSLKGSTARKKPAARSTPRTTGQRFNREARTATRSEPAPTDLAAARKGRQPAPLGSKATPEKGSGTETPGEKVESALKSTPTGDAS